MLNLIKWEFKKLFDKKMIWAALACLIILTISVSGGSSFYANSTVYGKGENTVYSHEAVKKNLEINEKYKGVMTDEKVKQIIEDYNLSYKIEKIKAGDTGYEISYMTEYEHNIATSFAMSLIDENGDVRSVDTLTQNEKPLIFGFADGYIECFYDIGMATLFIAIILIVLCSPVFADEISSKTDRIILSSKYGKNKVATAKCITMLLVTAAMFIISCSIIMFQNFISFGFEGANVSASAVIPGISLNQSVFSLMIVQIILCFISLTVTSFITLLISTKIKAFITLIISTAIFLIPCVIIPKPGITGAILGFFPSVYIRLISYISYLPQSCLPVIFIAFGTVSAFIAVICAFLCHKFFKNHQVS